MGGVAAQGLDTIREGVGGSGVIEATSQFVQQRSLCWGGHYGLVFERVRDAAEQIGGEHGATEIAREHANAERKGARDGGENLSRKSLRARHTLCVEWRS